LPAIKHTKKYKETDDVNMVSKEELKNIIMSEESQKDNPEDFIGLKQEISRDELFDVFEFARAYSGYYQNGIFNPDLINQRMKEISENPKLLSESELNTALANPKYNEESLRDMGKYFENTNMTYKKMLERFGKMLSFDYSTDCINIKDPKEYKSERFKADERRMHSFFDKFNVKAEFKTIMQKMIRDDAAYVAFRTDGNKYGLQPLPTKHCKITGRWENGFLFDFNMIWFISNSGVDINCYPPVFKERLSEMGDVRTKKYIPSSNVATRSGEYMYWTQLSPEDNVWVWKLDDVDVAQKPFFSPLFKDLLTSDTVRSLQKNKYMIAASRILVGLIPMIKEQTAGNVRDKIALDPKTIGRFMNLFRKGIDDSITTVAAPFEDVKEFDFASPNSDQNIQVDHNRNVIASSGTITDLIYPSTNMNGITFNYAAAVEEYMMTYVYPMFSDFVEYQINKRTKKYKFKVVFEGVETPQDRSNRFQVAKDLASIGIVLPEKIAAAIGMQPQDLIRQMERAKASGFVDNIQSIFNAQNGKGNEDETGRPRSTDIEISESGAKTRDKGTNVTKGGKV